ncbi:hypothetical protein QTO34_005600 [Cnephaeus nilssonii]|uniref:Uncharacterized protein n=1 Tax=Cnephaeus nilssonii TaxID=3371016 RepID=A0AA40HNP9_CNENI|nr:hypothetical protein QTO34_005600 [Eptesicus nilssonii]
MELGGEQLLVRPDLESEGLHFLHVNENNSETMWIPETERNRQDYSSHEDRREAVQRWKTLMRGAAGHGSTPSPRRRVQGKESYRSGAPAEQRRLKAPAGTKTEVSELERRPGSRVPEENWYRQPGESRPIAPIFVQRASSNESKEDIHKYFSKNEWAKWGNAEINLCVHEEKLQHHD